MSGIEEETLSGARLRDRVAATMKTRELRPPPLHVWRIPRVKYECMVTAGAFGPEDRVELLDGFLIVREPQGSRHAVAVGLIRAALERAFGEGYHVREEKPLALDTLSEPEPDLMVVRGRLRDYRDAHPSAPVLVVEVADTSVGFDLETKIPLYARAGIPESWLVHLPESRIEAHRQPTPTGYQEVIRLARGMRLTPLAFPDLVLAVDDILGTAPA